MANTPISAPITSFTVPWSLLGPLVNSVPEGWTDISYTAAMLGSAFEHTLIAVDNAGVTYRIRGIDELADAAKELRRTEYSRENGPWFGLTIMLKSVGVQVMTRHYGVAPDFEQPVPDAAYAEDLRLFPRDDASIPDWLREKAGLLPAAAAPGGQPARAAAPAELRNAKVYDGKDPKTGAPIVHRAGLKEQEAGRVLDYLKAAPVFLMAHSLAQDAFFPQNPPAVPLTFATDGTWIWAGAVAYYLEKYRMPPENDLLAHIRAQNYTLPEVTQQAKDAARDQMTGGGPGGPKR